MSCFRYLCKNKGSNNNLKKHYDVYLSFCGKGTFSFVSHLNTALCAEPGISVFWDEQRSSDYRGDQVITPSVLNVIGTCRIAIIVFSKNYADSRWCLQELEKITKCCRTKGLAVVTLFYFFDFSDGDGGLFGKAFYDFIFSKAKVSEDKLMSWVAVINEATIFSRHVLHTDLTKMEDITDVVGYLRDDEFLHEWKGFGNLVRHVIHALHKTDMFIADFPVGVKSHVQNVILLLNQAKPLLLIGIWGMIGIGKSAIARKIYDLIGPYFEEKSFVNLGENYFEIKQLQRKRVLVILDNVTELEELIVLRESPEWFGEGSKIIITTRDKQLLKEYGVNHIYKVKELDQTDSLEVFNHYAFKKNESHKQDFVELSRQFIAYTGGLPLALEVLGSSMHKKLIPTWKDKLRQLKRFPNQIPEILDNLKLSLSGLNDEERIIFFDIACFFVGMDQEDVPHTSQISLLEDKCLVSIDENNKIRMHVLLQGMARELIDRESTNTLERKTFDVFLSFRGKDSRAKFISHLYSSFQNAAIYVFRDDDEIQRGDQISISLLQAIGRSRVCVVVLSRMYANSRWCMFELEKIMKVHKTRNIVVVPVFYEVDPSEVRNQIGEFGKAFNDLISKVSMDESTEKNWRRDLHEIGSIAGFVIISSRNESTDIDNIVRHVTLLLDRIELFIAEHPVGVESRVQIATKLLNIQKSQRVQVGTKLSRINKEEDVILLGIWGMGGMGKTTIAKAIYNQIGKEFEGRSFLLDIREIWEKSTNQAYLQQLILCDIYKTTALKIHDIESGKVILEERLSQKRVLVVLDDVNELDQLRALCGSRKWFGPGSRIIITTRDIHLLRSCGVDHVYTIKEMDESESLELFSWHAFKQAYPKKDFSTYSKNVVTYCGRLPLALQVLGSYLYDRGIKEWEGLLEKLKIIPNDHVQKKLKLSFDDLSDDTEKQIFIDIACFFIGMDRYNVIQILNGCHFFADIGVNVLIERSLVTVDHKNKLRMHDLLKTMGREIVREESPHDPAKRSRVWLREEVLDILSKHKGTEDVKGLALKLPIQNTNCLHTKAFKKMNKLKLLQLAGVQLDGDFKYLSGDLRWLCWHGFPSTYIPKEFQQRNLVSIELKYSNLKQIWRKNQMLENLKILNLSHSQYLTTTPDFSYLPNLEKLVLKDCPRLSAVSHNIGSLHKLLLIDLTNCRGLHELPRSIYKLKRLETLILSGCLMIEKLEEDIEQMESLITLIADRTSIKKIPFSIVRSKNIGYISLCGFEGFSRNVFPSLIRTWMSPTNNVISLCQISTSVPSLVSSDFSYGTLKDFLKLRSLCVECDSELQLTQDVARILVVLKATNSQKLEASTCATISQISDVYASTSIDLSQVHISRSKGYLKSLLIQMGMECQVLNTVEDVILQSTTDGNGDSFSLLSDNYSNWLTFDCKGCSVIFEVPKMKGINMKRMMLKIDYTSSSDNVTSEDCQGVLIMNYTKRTIHLYKRTTLTSFDNEEWQSITSNLEPGNKLEVMVIFGEGFIVEKTTLSLLYDEPNNSYLENSHLLSKEDVIVFGDDDHTTLRSNIPYVSKETSNHSNPIVEENCDDRKEENPSKNQKIDTTSEDESMTSRKTQKRKKDTSPKDLKIVQSREPLLSSAQLENTGILSNSSNSTFSYLDDFKKMLDIDPLAVMDQLLPREVATSQTELFALEAELGKLRQLALTDKLFVELPNNQELQSAINVSIQYIKARHKYLNLQQYNGISAFSKLFNEAIDNINVGNIVSHQLSQLAYEENEAMIELQSSKTEINQETKRMTEIEVESRQIKDQIASLKEKLRLLKQEKNVLEANHTSCTVKLEEAMNKGRDISLTVISIKEKIERYKNQERENNAKYAELIDSYETMKVSLPF